MISNKDIHATLDENGESLVFENKELSNMQKLSTSIIEKINSAINLNEKILVIKKKILIYLIVIKIYCKSNKK